MFGRLLRRRPAPGTIMGALALFISLGGIGYAATGGTFILGRANTATTSSSLSAPIAGGKTLQLTNTSATGGSTALGLSVAAGKAPFTVNSSGKVTNLNADRLDGKDSTQLSPASGDGRTADIALLGGVRKVLTANITTAGSSSLLASATVQVNGNGDELVSCQLGFDDTNYSVLYTTRIVETGRPIDVTSLAVVWAHGVGAGAHTVDLWCASSPSGVIVDNAGLIVSAHL